MTVELVLAAITVKWHGKHLVSLGLPLELMFGLISWLEEGVQDL